MQTFSTALTLTSVPDDVLDIVFDETTTMNPGPKAVSALQKAPMQTINISQTCRRFRTLVLQSPNLWTSLSTALADGIIAMCLERSKDLQLDVEIDLQWARTVRYHGYGRPLGPFFQKIVTFVKMSPRWCNLSIIVPCESDIQELMRPHKWLAKTRAPNLRRVAVTSSNLTVENDLARTALTLQ